MRNNKIKLKKDKIKKFIRWAKRNAGKVIKISGPKLVIKFGISKTTVNRIKAEFNIQTKGRIKPKVQFCPLGHDTFVCGRDRHLRCIKCVSIDHPLKRGGQPKKLCSKGHNKNIVGRAIDGHCIKCVSKSRKKSYRRHKIKILKKQKRYYKKHKVKKRKYNRKYRLSHLEKLKRLNKEWRKNNPFKLKKYRREHAGKIKLQALKGHKKRKKRIPNFGQKGIYTFYKKCPVNKEVDHIIPLCGKKVSGLHVRWNLQYLTFFQNRKKGNFIDLVKASIRYGKLLKKLGLK